MKLKKITKCDGPYSVTGFRVVRQLTIESNNSTVREKTPRTKKTSQTCTTSVQLEVSSALERTR